MSGENNPFFGKHLSESHKINLSISHKGINTWSKGRKHTEEEIDKIKQNTPRGEKHSKYWLGKHLTQDHRDNISYGSPHISGKDHPMYGMCKELHWNWQGGKTTLGEIIRHCDKNKEWIKSVFVRDNYTCQECHKFDERDIVAHHIKQFSEILYEYNIQSLEETYLCQELWDINNGITLCEECHDKIPIKRKHV